ncbi:tyrosine-type recombinase/integrase [Pedobacter sp.]|uniref:tyrosine-type recombinase/integrase n=1 Tax=Pedobacter sp. TaxID=1411316 RepID=UPI003BAA2B0B
MEIPELPYTLPRIVKTKSAQKLNTGSNSISRWYVEFFYFDATTEKMERFRFTKNLNRLHDLKEKQKHFNNLREAYKIALENGWSPVDQNANIKLKKEVVGINLKQGLVKFEEYHTAKGTRPKTISTYRSKVEAFIKYHGAETNVSAITDFEVTDFLNFMESRHKWVGVTYVNSRICLNNYFRYLLLNKYIKVNPVTGTESRRRMATQSNQVFSDKDFKIISKWLQDNDPYCLFFVKMIYFTCIRPKELRFLKLIHIDMEEYTITVPGTIAKNKKSIPINIDIKLREELHKMNLADYPRKHIETIFIYK